MQHTDGISSQVRLWLVVGDIRFDLAAVGPEQCTLREPAEIREGSAQIVIEVDGRQHTSNVQLISGEPNEPRCICFRPA